MLLTEVRSIAGRLLNHRTLIPLLCIQPLFVLTVQSWSSGALVLGGLTSLITIVLLKQQSFDGSPEKTWQYQAFLLSFSLLFICIGITGLLRQDLHVAHLDSPARFLLAIPIFILIRRSTVDALSILTMAIVIGTLLTLSIQLLPSARQPWDANRMSSHFADPLSFGYITLAFALLALTSIWQTRPHGPKLTVLKGLAFTAGLYMSIQTQSRTGWLAIPVLAAIAIYVNRNRLPSWRFSIPAFLVITSMFALYNSSEIVQTRINQTLDDISHYSFEGVAPETSVGLRLTFLRIAADMISQKPVLGYGDTQVTKPEVPVSVKAYASDFAIDFALSAGFHNEIVTTAVQYGLFSALAAALCFLIPLSIYWIGLQSESSTSRQAASLGIAFTLVYMMSSISTEVFGLKYTVSLYAMTTAILCGIVTRDHQSPRT